MPKTKKYSADEGWVTVRIEIVPGTKWTQEDVVKIFSNGRASVTSYEVAEFKHYKTVVRMVLRRIS